MSRRILLMVLGWTFFVAGTMLAEDMLGDDGT